MIYILGVSRYYHDAAAALLQDGQLIATAEEECFSRLKHDSGFPRNAIRFCLDASKIRGVDVDYVVFFKNSFRLSSAAKAAAEETESKAAATLDNYEVNLQMLEILGKAYGFRVLCFWQPALVYGRKSIYPFEMIIADNRSARNYFNVLTKVYQEAERRAATDDAFVFLGGVFDSVNEPVYIDKWMHLAPLGNELVARSVADYVEGSLHDRPKLSKPHADKHALGDQR